MTGIVKFFDAQRGWGYIRRTGGGTDVFLHYKDIAGKGFRTVEEGDEVEFQVNENHERGPRAEQCVVWRKAVQRG